MADNSDTFPPSAGPSFASPSDRQETLPLPPTSSGTGNWQHSETLAGAPTIAAGVAMGLAPTIAGYDVLGELGRGGMGVVYKARQKGLNRTVALKMILSGEHAGAGELARFRAEAEAVARLQHPNIVQVHEIGQHDNLPFFSLEFVDGGSLAQQLKGVPQPPVLAARLVETLARAVHAAHQKGVIHRDLKPANILLAGESISSGKPQAANAPRLGDYVPKITDFGLAKRLDDSSGATQAGTIMGTPSYMPPEQAAGKTEQLGPPADIYSLGAILYECLTGRPPFVGATSLETVMQVVHDEPVPPTRLQAKVPRDLETISLKCLQKDAGRRYGSAEELADDLRRFLDGAPILARPVGYLERLGKWARRRPAVAALLLLVLLVTLAGGALVTWKWLAAERAERIAAKNAREEKAAKEKTAEALALAEKAEQKAADKAKAEAAARRDAELLLCGLALDKGLELCERGDTNRGLLWLARALKQVPDGATDLERSIRTNLAGWAPRVHPLRAILDHPSLVLFAFWAGNGSRIVTATQDAVHIWDAANYKSLHELPQKKHVTMLLVSPDGKTVVVGHGDGSAKLLDVARGVEKGKSMPVGGKDRVTEAAFSADSKRVVLGSKDGATKVFDAATGELIAKGPEVPANLFAVALSPDGLKVAEGRAHSLRLWSVKEGKQTWQVQRQKERVESVLFSNNGDWVAAESDRHVRLYDAKTGKQDGSEMFNESQVLRLTLSPTGKVLLTGGTDGVVRLWDVETRKVVATFDHGEHVRSVAFSRNGRQILTASADGTARLWHRASGQLLPPILRHTNALESASLDPSGRKILTHPTGRKSVRIWEVARDIEPLKLFDHGGMVLAADFDFDGKRVLTGSGGGDGTARVWDVESEQVLRRHEHLGRVEAVAWSRDGRWIASGGNDRVVRLAPVDSKSTPRELAHDSSVEAIAFSPDSKLLATGCLDGMVRVWNLEGKKERETICATRIYGLAWSPDSKTLALGTHDNAPLFWDITAAKPTPSALRHQGLIYAVGFSPNGELLATGSWDQTARIWNLKTGKPVCSPLEHQGIVRTLAFSRDGEVLATGGTDHAVRFWNAKTGRTVAPTLMHPDIVWSVAWSPDGKQILTGCKDRAARLWPLALANPVKESAEEVKRQMEILTAQELDKDGALRVLSPENWQKRRDKGR